jgi:FkbM family methyltransferase
MAGATGNVYCGLHEFEDMAFVLHLLGKGDLLADVGANIGSYSILAASRGARAVTFEPGPEARARLEDNVRLNGFEEAVEVRAEAVGATEGEAAFTVGRDTVNHLLVAGEKGSSESVKVTTLDTALGNRAPTLIKIDVEGGETDVLTGAVRSLSSEGLLGLIVEIWDPLECNAGVRLREGGFVPVTYEPFTRTLSSSAEGLRGNTIFVRDAAMVQKRLRSTPSVSVLGSRL